MLDRLKIIKYYSSIFSHVILVWNTTCKYFTGVSENCSCGPPSRSSLTRLIYIHWKLSFPSVNSPRRVRLRICARPNYVGSSANRKSLFSCTLFSCFEQSLRVASATFPTLFLSAKCVRGYVCGEKSRNTYFFYGESDFCCIQLVCTIYKTWNNLRRRRKTRSHFGVYVQYYIHIYYILRMCYSWFVRSACHNIKFYL